MTEVHTPADRRRLQKISKGIRPLTAEFPINRSDLVYHGPGWDEEVKPEEIRAEEQPAETIIVEFPPLSPQQRAQPRPTIA